MAKGVRSYNSALERLNRYLRDHDKRPSKVRNIVLSCAFGLRQPFTAEQLLTACEAEHISVGTVYNSLEVFCEAGIVRAITRQRGKAATEYEIISGSASRFQMICKKCGRTVDISDKAISRLIKERKYSNFDVQHFSLFVYGECKICRKRSIKTQLRSRSSIE